VLEAARKFLGVGNAPEKFDFWKNQLLVYGSSLLEIATMNQWFGINDGLAAAGRFPSITRMKERISTSEIILLLLCGAAAAASSSFIRTGLRIPGNAIVLSMIPMALGLALAPRHLAGFIMGVGALSTALGLNTIGMGHIGSGSFISLCLLGPVMDFAVKKVHSGWRLYAGLILAGICTNFMALTSRGISKLVGFDLDGMRPFGTWLAQAAVTYTLSGAIAGLICALCFFHLRKEQSDPNA
jgi:hypothetical protein